MELPFKESHTGTKQLNLYKPFSFGQPASDAGFPEKVMTLSEELLQNCWLS